MQRREFLSLGASIAGGWAATQVTHALPGKIPVIDTRTGLVAANPSNPALCIYDYLTNSDYGLGVNPATIDIPSVNAAANICEEQVIVFIGA